jgi:hypothetical protein
MAGRVMPAASLKIAQKPGDGMQIFKENKCPNISAVA